MGFHPGLTMQQSEELEMVQMRALAIIYPGLSYPEALIKANLQKISVRRIELCCELFKAMQKETHRLNRLLPYKNEPVYNLRRNITFSVNTKPSVLY